MTDLSGKVAVVTGASKGIGAGIALELAAAGAAVVVNYASSAEGAERVVQSIRQQGGKAIAVQADVSKAGDIGRLFDEATAAFGPPDVLVNNAGVYAFLVLTTQEALKHFNPQGASVINISSVVGDNPFPNTVVYSATKGAVDNITKTLAKELAGRNIRVNTIAPGGVDTEGAHTLGMIGGEMEQSIVSQTPLGRIGRPDDIGKVAVFLASDQSAWLTGERISASGGLH
jgi:3-oxoacyl-[acyl-carrier protein] reductase